jgi:MtrB/PioB family decaheme-associated outer membrane protein
MKRKLIAVLVSNLFVGTGAAYAQSTGLKWTGEVTAGLRYSSVKANDDSKFREYRDISDGTDLINAFDLRAQDDRRRFSIFFENLGSDDKYFDFRGTEYGNWKFRLYDSEFRHRFGSGPGALTPFSGVGSSVLTGTFPNLNPGTWNRFDDSLKRRDTGGFAEWSGGSPWYIRFDGNEVKREGVKVIAGPLGTSPGNGSIDLPAPVDWRTYNASAEAGYQGPRQHFAITGGYSKFENDNLFLNWSNPFFAPGLPGLRDTSVLPAENEMWKIAANGNWRGLPFGSSIAGRFTYSKLTNDVQVLPTMLTGVAAPNQFQSTASSVPFFHGEVKTTTASVSLNSSPMRALDTRVYYNYREKQNDSTQITFNPTAASGLQCGGGVCSTELFSYSKHQAGMEAYYRLNPENRLGAGYEYEATDRERTDFPKTTDNKYFAEWRNSTFDTVDGRLKYQYLQRRSTVNGVFDPANPIDAFVRRFDYMNLDQHMVRMNLGANPAPLVDLGLDVYLKFNDYQDVPLGRNRDRRYEYYLSAGYGDPSKFRALLFADIEFVQYESTHRVQGTPGVGGSDPNAPPAPAAPAISTTYTWGADNKDRSWQTGLAVDWQALPKLMVKSSFVYAETRGTADFAAQPGTILAAPGLVGIGNFDNTRRIALNVRGVYQADKNWKFTGGYAFEQYRYNDVGYQGFQYTIPAGTAPTFTSTSYYTGQLAFQPYTAHIVYLYGTYRF